MGNCVQICGKGINRLSDIAVGEYPKKINSNFNNTQFRKPETYCNLLFLQFKIKKFLLRIKNCTINEKKPSLNKKNSKKPSSTSNLKAMANGTNPNNLTNTQEKNKKKGKRSKNEEPQVEDLLIPQIALNLRGDNIMSFDPFLKKTYKTNITNLEDPRNGPMDGVRRTYDKIIQDDFSYKGEWKNRQRDGIGLLVWGKMVYFIGEFKEDRVIGFGKLVHDDGNIYTGYWNNFQAEGVGVYKSRKNIKFEGFWKADRQEDFGIESWYKNSYTGDYKEGKKCGIGMFKMEDKGLYQGEIKNGNIHGIGCFVFKDKRKYEGEWRNNKMDGFGIINWPDGKTFVGEFHEDKPEGFGIYYTKKKIFVGFWFCGLLEGEVIIVEGEKMKKQYFEDGRLTQNLANDYEIFFEKCINDLIKSKKFFGGK